MYQGVYRHGLMDHVHTVLAHNRMKVSFSQTVCISIKDLKDHQSLPFKVVCPLRSNSPIVATVCYACTALGWCVMSERQSPNTLVVVTRASPPATHEARSLGSARCDGTMQVL